jgi:NADH-quinone oxidoreductase subunit G
MATVYINDQAIDIGDEKLNLVQAAQRGGIFIPHYCYHPALSVVASCRMCLVEIGTRKDDGTVVMQKAPPPFNQNKVVPACQQPATHNTVCYTQKLDETRGVIASKTQADSLEALLLNHPLDCPVCDKAGECKLQDFSYKYGHAESRMIDEKNHPPNKPHIGPNITLFADRCILCTRCVRFTREVSGEGELQVIHRGHHEEIDIFPGDVLDNKLATNVVDLCPVGALCSKDFLYKHRVWNLKTVDSVCPDCSTGCSIHLDTNKSIVYRLRPRENPQAQGHFMCDDGRLGYHYINAPDRFSRYQVRRGQELAPVPYDELIRELKQELATVAKQDGGAVAAVLSPFLTCEEAYLLAKYFKGLSPQVRLVLGPVPVVGEDDTYPKDRRGRPTEPVQFTIRAEKCPNRRGVEEILRHFQGELLHLDEVVRAADAGKLKAVYVAGGYPPRDPQWITDAQAASLRKVPTLVVQDLQASPVSGAARYLIPASAFAEKDGTFVNHAGLAQAIHRGVNPTGEQRTDGQVFLDLMERRGLLHVATLRQELAREVPFFAALGGGDLGEYGIRLGQ